MNNQMGNRQQRNMRQAGGKKRELFYFIIICMLLTLNLVFLVILQSQMKSMNIVLKQLLGRITLAQQEEGTVSWAEADVAGAELEQGVLQQAKKEDGSKSGRDKEDAKEQDYVQLCGLSAVDKPEKRTQLQVLERLEELAADSEVISRIREESSLYPDEMLEALANNPEMALFVEGYLTSEKKPAGGLTKTEKESECPLLLQWDSRWGYVEYGDDSNIGLSGCGPTCLSMVLCGLLGDESLTPDKIAEYAMDNGYYMAGTGTTWALMQDYPAMYGVGVRQVSPSEWTMKNILDKGGVIICSMKPGDFTAGGHFIVIYGYDKEGFLVNDPNCVARSRVHWSFEDIGKQIKNVWIYEM